MPLKSKKPLWERLIDQSASQRNHADTIRFAKRAIAVAERTVGKDHPDFSEALENLAHRYRQHGDYANAEKLYIHAFMNREGRVDTDLLYITESLFALEELYRLQNHSYGVRRAKKRLKSLLHHGDMLNPHDNRKVAQSRTLMAKRFFLWHSFPDRTIKNRKQIFKRLEQQLDEVDKQEKRLEAGG